MHNADELTRERAYAAHVQHIMMALIERSKAYSQEHVNSVRAMLADAWEELRLRPTAISPQELEQLSGNIDQFSARKNLTDSVIARYEKMLPRPFFARIDFCEDNRAPDKIVIGLYSLQDKNGDLLIHDWRAPVCSLYYDDNQPGERVSYECPDGVISGKLTRKRQYRMENGVLLYYVDTDMRIDDEMLLEILSGATSRHMRNIVSTIQAEQDRAIRLEGAKILSVTGSAGSGKTSVAMHRAAYLLYRQRETLRASNIVILSPSASFSEYISNVLPDLGEENATAVTLDEIYEKIFGKRPEDPLRRLEALLEETEGLRHDSVRTKSGAEFAERARAFVRDFTMQGPRFEDIALDGKVLISAAEMTRMYRSDFLRLTPALRMVRIRAVIDSRSAAWERSLARQYEAHYTGSYRGNDLDRMVGLSVSSRMQPVRRQIKAMLTPDPLWLFARFMESAAAPLKKAAEENAAAGVIWQEDAPAIAYFMLALGFAAPEKSARHLMIDEAQDLPEIAMLALRFYYPGAHVTLLGDENQRTCPAMPRCEPSHWGRLFGDADAPLVKLARAYRSTVEITRFCEKIGGLDTTLAPFGRHGEAPETGVLSEDSVITAVQRWMQADKKRVAVVTRTQSQAEEISRRVPNAHLLDGSETDVLTEPGDVPVGCYHMMKGLEFDAVIVAWPDGRLTDGERRRLYTACSRALHGLTFLSDGKLLREAEEATHD